MSDDVRAVLTRASDARLADAVIPPVSEIHRRAELGPALALRRPSWLAPVVAAAAVIALVLGVAQLPSLRQDTDQVAVKIPPAPKLEPVVPPMVVRTRLGAPPGHLNGPPVASAQTLAVAPSRAHGRGLRTVAVVTPHTPDRAGNPRVNRCLYTYSEPDSSELYGRCDWAQPVELETPEQALTLEVHGPPGRTWLQGTAPVNTAAVLLRSPGSKQVAVAVGDPGETWNHRPFYAVWRARVATDLTAVDRSGRVLGRAHLPSDKTRHAPGDPELGTVETPLGLWEHNRPRHCALPPPTPAPTTSPCKPTTAPRPARTDVLARYEISETVTLFKYGFVAGADRCLVDVVRDYRADAPPPHGGGGGCGYGHRPDREEPIEAGRSFSAGTGKPEEQIINGSAPAGTVRLRLSAAGHPSAMIRAYDGGPRWLRRTFFIAPWPSAPHTKVEALGADGQVLATVVSRGLNPRAFDGDYLEALAACMERRGVEVVRTPQGHGMPPAYQFRPGGRSGPQMRALQESCEDEASATS